MRALSSGKVAELPGAEAEAEATPAVPEASSDDKADAAEPVPAAEEETTEETV